MPKSVTVAVAFAVAVKLVPGTEICALLLTVDGHPPTGVLPEQGVKITVTVAVAPEFNALRLQVTVPPVPLPQLPAEVDADVNVAPDVGRKSVNVVWDVRSPLLVMVYVNVTPFPAPTGDGLAVAVSPRLMVGVSFVTKASLGPFSAPCKGLAVGKGVLPDVVSPAT